MGSTLIIAEAGVNHNGNVDTACLMVDRAAACGADAVKFQTFSADRMVSRHAEKADYQKLQSGADETQYEMLKRLELNRDAHEWLRDRCAQRGVMFLSAPFDIESIDLLVSLGLTTFKIPSGEITNLPYLRRIGRVGKKVIMSTGMSYLAEVRSALDVLTAAGTKRADITVLHCTTAYPTPFEDVNLRALTVMREQLGVAVGYSDHTPGWEVPAAAVALGAAVIEKHFTLDMNQPGPDHAASLDPEGFAGMVRAIRTIEKSLGTGVKEPSSSELKNRDIARKSIVARVPVKKGDILSEANVTVKRPGTGISPMRWDEVIGTVSPTDVEQDGLILP